MVKSPRHHKGSRVYAEIHHDHYDNYGGDYDDDNHHDHQDHHTYINNTSGTLCISGHHHGAC